MPLAEDVLYHILFLLLFEQAWAPDLLSILALIFSLRLRAWRRAPPFARLHGHGPRSNPNFHTHEYTQQAGPGWFLGFWEYRDSLEGVVKILFACRRIKKTYNGITPDAARQVYSSGVLASERKYATRTKCTDIGIFIKKNTENNQSEWRETLGKNLQSERTIRTNSTSAGTPKKKIMSKKTLWNESSLLQAGKYCESSVISFFSAAE